MLLKIIPLVLVCARLCNAIVYDRYSGEVATDEQLAKYEKIGATSTCTKDIKACDATEGRRVDGSCNSLDHPMAGTYFEPLRRVLPAHYYNGSYPRKAADGTDLKPPRVIRNLLLCVGQASHLDFTQAIPGYGIFSFGDIGSIHDIKYFLQNKTDCCSEEGMTSRECSPNIIPEDDPVHRFSDIRCMNLTTPLTYSDFGCTDDPEPSPIEQATGVFDLSPIYNAADEGDSAVRCYEGGKLSVDTDEDGIIWPPNGEGFCTANQPGENRCFGNYPNTLLPVQLLAIWYMRQHNYFADQLAAVNPCWDDDKLFHTARDMNIAFHTQVYYYKWLESLIGSKNLIEQGVLSNSSTHRDIYDESTYPHMSLEYTFVLRWFHIIQHGSAYVYDTDGTYLREYPIANFTMRPGYLGVDRNIVYFTQQMYRQPCAPYQHMVHPDLAENGLPYIQRAVDVVTSDLHKTRLLGLAPYIDYVHLCTGHKITCFDDLEAHMDKERIIQMKMAYDDVKDIELLAGIWSENLIEGGSIPATLACLLTEHLKKGIQSDRHWYERADRPNAFTEDQLLEIRKSTLSLLMCNVADGVTEVQPTAFRNIDSETNPLTPCSDIPSIDFTKWTDATCASDSSAQELCSRHSSTKSQSNPSKAFENQEDANQQDTPSRVYESQRNENQQHNPSHDYESQRNENQQHNPSHVYESQRNENQQHNPSHVYESQRNENQQHNPSHVYESQRNENQQHNPSHVDESQRNKNQQRNPSRVYESQRNENQQSNPSRVYESQRNGNQQRNPSRVYESQRNINQQGNPSRIYKSQRYVYQQDNPSRIYESQRNVNQQGNPSRVYESQQNMNQQGNPSRVYESQRNVNQQDNPSRVHESQRNDNQQGNPSRVHESQRNDNQQGGPSRAHESQRNDNQQGNPSRVHESQRNENQQGNPSRVHESQRNDNQKGNPSSVHESQRNDNQRGNPSRVHESQWNDNQQGNPSRVHESQRNDNQQGNPSRVHESQWNVNQQDNPSRVHESQRNDNQQGNPSRVHESQPNVNQQGIRAPWQPRKPSQTFE